MWLFMATIISSSTKLKIFKSTLTLERIEVAIMSAVQVTIVRVIIVLLVYITSDLKTYIKKIRIKSISSLKNPPFFVLQIFCESFYMFVILQRKPIIRDHN